MRFRDTKFLSTAVNLFTQYMPSIHGITAGHLIGPPMPPSALNRNFVALNDSLSQPIIFYGLFYTCDANLLASNYRLANPAQGDEIIPIIRDIAPSFENHAETGWFDPLFTEFSAALAKIFRDWPSTERPNYYIMALVL
jgi:hypothetical protein